MVHQCPYCTQNLNLSGAQLGKLEKALAKLSAGKILKLNCPHCQETMELTANGSLVSGKQHAEMKGATKPGKPNVAPPKAPGLNWLSSGLFEKKEIIKNILRVLILMDKSPARDKVAQAFTETEYEPVFPDSAKDAIERMQFTHFSSIVLHSRYEGNSLADSLFHANMRKLEMDRRRPIFYVLIGPEFNTFYDLQALTYSANLVVNDKEVNKMSIILKKAIPDYEDLFDPYIDALVSQGKKSGNIWVDVRREARPRLTSNVLKDLLADR